MQERAIHISSVNRQKIEQNKAEDFIIKFDPVLKLQNNMTHEIALDKATITYSWHNISEQYQNKEIKYSPDDGKSWETVKFVDGMYTYSDLNDYLHQYMKIIIVTKRKMAIGLLLITVETLHHLTGIMLESVLILK